MRENPAAITYTYVGLVDSVLTPVELFLNEYNEITSYLTNALWDTGAEMSVISPNVAEKLNLKILDKVKIAGIVGDDLVDTALVSIHFPSDTAIKDVRVVICDMSPGNEVIIGMDVITQMDIAVTNGKGKTQFSYAIPPFDEKIDFSKMDACVVVNTYLFLSTSADFCANTHLPFRGEQQI
jgi:predicted aspartyl protease